MTLRMLPAVIMCVVPLLGSGPVCAEDRRGDKTALTIMALNGNFLWDGKEPEQGTWEFDHKGSPEKAAAHMRGIAAIIKRVPSTGSGPDIVSITEAENLDALNALNEGFLQGCGYKAYLVEGTDDKSGRDVGLLTRIDPEDTTVHRTERKGTSGSVSLSVARHCYAKMAVNGVKIVLIGVHLQPSPSFEKHKLERQAEADAICSLARDLRKEGYLPVIAGGINDYDGDETCRDHVDNKPISNVLTTLKSMDPATPSDDLVNAAQFVPKEKRYTSFWDRDKSGKADFPKEYDSIDHVLLAPELAARVVSVEIDHTASITEVTDHFPVIVRLSWAAPGSGN